MITLQNIAWIIGGLIVVLIIVKYLLALFMPARGPYCDDVEDEVRPPYPDFRE